MTDKIPEQYAGEWTYEYERDSEFYEILDGGDSVGFIFSEEVAEHICKLHNKGYVAESPTSKELE